MTAHRSPSLVDTEFESPTLDPVEVRFAADLANLHCVRSIVAALASLVPLTDEATADLQLVVSEVCTALINAAHAPDATITLTVTDAPDHLDVTVTTTGDTSAEVLAAGDFAWHVLTALTESIAPLGRPSVDGLPGLLGYELALAKR
ncbi:ATP-binding protein [Mycolicibacterium grossiae]|nr:ATP-binding protein [Mycolicibacterium grossiae]